MDNSKTKIDSFKVNYIDHLNLVEFDIIVEGIRDIHKVTQDEFKLCCYDLNIKTLEGLFPRFREVCEWFIQRDKVKQLVHEIEFEEINK